MRQIFGQKNVVRVIALGKDLGNGSGVVLKEGILTNNHVIEGALKIYVEFHGVSGYHEITIIGRDPAADLALLTAPLLPEGITPVTLGDTLQIGDRVYTMGYPLGVRSVTVGNVNATESESWLYAITQAPLAPGNSGGPLLNGQGKMAGVNTAIASIPGVLISFALPAEYVKSVLPRLTRERVVRHGAAGFVFYDATRILPVFLERMGLSYPPYEGVMVIVVPPSSPPDRAGIRPGDYIIKFNGIPMKSARDLEKRIFFDHRPDEEVELELKRGGQVFIKKFVLSEYISPFRR
ncbi:MAG: trypsin-like peptidase domain-containing protein [bacterium]|nr:trypsin-like peptidase domain-containing protein [bacterium]